MSSEVLIKKHVSGEHLGWDRYWFDYAGISWEMLTIDDEQGQRTRCWPDNSEDPPMYSIWTRHSTFAFDEILSVQSISTIIGYSLRYFSKGEERGAADARHKMQRALGL